jgi:hypothetical protein
MSYMDQLSSYAQDNFKEFRTKLRDWDRAVDTAYSELKVHQ